MPTNSLYYGDNLDVLRRHLATESVDLVYLDPPFKSDQDYNVLFRERDGSRASSQIAAFQDTWHWDHAAALAYQEAVESGGPVAETLRAFRTLVGDSDMLAYLSMMAPRLVELHRVLRPTGSLYLHCDPTASHYLKLLLDAVFEPQHFKNEIIWRRTGSHGPRRSFGPIHDTLLFYVKSSQYYFKLVRKPYTNDHVRRRYRQDEKGLKFVSGGNVLTGAGATGGESGQEWRGFDPSAKRRHWAIPGFLTEQMEPEFEQLGVLQKLETLFAAGLIDINPGAAWPTPVRYLRPGDGQPLSDIWAYQPGTEGTVYGTNDGIDNDVKWLGPTDPERLGYQTQKPLGLMERIILSSCPEDGVVLDPFCGCGTTIDAAHDLHRTWIGIDVTHVAVNLIKTRLADRHGLSVRDSYEVIGEPASVEDAAMLAEEDPWQFQAWALGLVGARLAGPTKKGADRGIDGRLYFHDQPSGPTKQIVISVKAGSVTVSQLRDLRGVIDREEANIGVLISLRAPTEPMRREVASSGFYTSPWGKHPRLQILTIAELFAGARIDYPASSQTNVTFTRSRRARGEQAKTIPLGLPLSDNT